MGAIGASWFETAQERLLTMRDRLNHAENRAIEQVRTRLVERRVVG
jgi:hypothetical protein